MKCVNSTPATVEATFENICMTDPDWTEIQTAQYLDGFAGREITGWEGWVYEVNEFNGEYRLLLAMEPPGGIHGRLLTKDFVSVARGAQTVAEAIGIERRKWSPTCQDLLFPKGLA